MNDTELLLKVESKKKSGAIAALLNLILPGAGYMYCGRWILGIIAFIFVLLLAVASFGTLAVPIWLILIVDGLLCANRYNKQVIKDVLAEQERAKSY